MRNLQVFWGLISLKQTLNKPLPERKDYNKIIKMYI